LESRGERPAGQEIDELAAPTHGTLGRKATVPYGLYRAHGFFNPHFAHRTGAATEDLELFWRALENMWDLDRSSSRGLMACRGIYIFSHDSPLGNAPAHKLFERIQVQRKDGVDAPRSFSHYTVSFDDSALPSGVTLTRLAE
jgi:CRISPR-associated protein Csd2